MPVPIYFTFDDREASVTQDEARMLAARLDAAPELRSDILIRVDGTVESPIDLKFARDGDLVVLQQAIESLQAEGEDVPSFRMLKARASNAMKARGLGD